jgi:sulfur carrier protein
MPKIMLNGKEHDFEGEVNIAELLRELKLPSAGLAVAVNDSVISNDEHPTHRLNDGDRIEIIKAIGGG